MKGPGFDFMNNPQGNMELADKYMKEAGYPSGKYTGSDELLWSGRTPTRARPRREVAKAQLEKLGFKIKFRMVPQDAVYTNTASVPERRSRLRPTRVGSRTSPTRSRCSSRRSRARHRQRRRREQQLAQLNDPKINEAMNKAALLDGHSAHEAWANIDKMIVDAGPGRPVPLGQDHADPVQGRQRRGQRVLRRAGLRVHVAEVGA